MESRVVCSRRWIARAARRGLAPVALLIAGMPALAQEQLFLHQFGTSVVDQLKATVPDGNGGVFAGGQTLGSFAGPNAGLADAWIARYGSSGDPIWTRQIGTTEDDSVEAMAPDGSGGVYACGVTDGKLGPFRLMETDAWIARYDADGNQLWLRQIHAQIWARDPNPDGFQISKGLQFTVCP